MLCPACSRVVPDHARFCAACGRSLVSALSPTFTSPAGAFIPRSITGEPPRTAGTVLADRYRIVGLLGRGGMGEVYRADDLKLGQPVALKFLPGTMNTDPEAVARFHNEVRVARQVSHPNVCRLYDLSEAEGEPFLSMEYVDGEDLASLLRRIGWLPSDKAIQVARQLCSGLSAAHDLGVLHRDLKPANVMLDGRGVAKITDFGLADFVERIGAHEVAGTPGYMAPEQLTGGPASIKSDIYALGLVLFEIFTGKPAFIPGSAEDRMRVSRDSSPPTPASAQPAIDPTIERLIVRCLDPDPARRPASARAIAAALPGGDPLAAALAAGETPSPQMVAEAGGVGSLTPPVAWSLVAAIVAFLMVIAVMNDRVQLHRTLQVNLSPDVLSARAKSVLARAGRASEPRDAIHGFDYDLGYAGALSIDGSAAAWDKVKRGRPALIQFWYREGPSPLAPWTPAQRATLTDPPPIDPGSATVILDPRGRLLRLTIIPVSQDAGISSPAAALDWGPMFEEAGLRISDFTSVAPAQVPPTYADSRAAWTGAFPENPSIPVRVEAAGLAGSPVYFHIVNPWPEASASAVIRTTGLLILTVIVVVLIVAAALLARRNIRLARSDLRSAFRVGLFGFLLAIPLFLFGTHHVAGIEELLQLIKAASTQLIQGASLWLAYVAVEPFVRRRWPELIVSSTRLLAGRVRDPLIGRDVLIGGLIGVAGSLPIYQGIAMAGGGPLMLTLPYVFGPMGNQAHTLALFAQVASIAVQDALGVMMILLILTVVLRKRWLVIVAFFGFMLLLLEISSPPGPFRWPAVIDACLVTFVIVRFGILAGASCVLFRLGTDWFPITADLNAFYFAASLIPITLLLALVWFGLHTSLGGKPLAGWTERESL